MDAKQAWAAPLDADAKAKGFLGWHQRGYRPHYDAPGVTQIVTLRLADSLPASRRGEWEQLLRIEEDRERRRRLEEYLDTVIQDAEHREKATRYIENNPVKAGMVIDPKEWAWSSARFRDEYAVLKCPPLQKPLPERRLAAGLTREKSGDDRDERGNARDSVRA